MSSEAPLPFGTRLWFSWVCFFRVLFDATFAARAFAVRDAMPALPAAAPAAAAAERAGSGSGSGRGSGGETEPKPPSIDPALQLLALFQREGRFVDFLEEDVAAFTDAEVGAAARVVHDGCRKTLRAHGKLAPVRSEEEGAKVTVAAGASPAEVKLVGNVTGAPPRRPPRP